MTTTAPKKSHKGRKRLGKEPFAVVAFAVPPGLLDAIDLVVEAGLGTRSSIARTLIEAGVDAGGLEALAARSTSDDEEGEPARKPGPGRKRVGRERMVNVSTMLEPAKLDQIMQIAEPAGLPRGDALRRLALLGYAQLLAGGYQQLPAYKRAACKKRS